jgi:hypothetical protein
VRIGCSVRELRRSGPLATTARISVTQPSRSRSRGTLQAIPPLGSALLGQRTLSSRPPSVARPAHGAEVGEVAAATGLGLDDVIDLGGSADADVGEAQLAPVAVALEYPLADGLSAGAVGVEVGRWRVRPGSPPALGAPGRRLPSRSDRDLVGASVREAHPHHRGCSHGCQSLAGTSAGKSAWIRGRPSLRDRQDRWTHPPPPASNSSGRWDRGAQGASAKRKR